MQVLKMHSGWKYSTQSSTYTLCNKFYFFTEPSESKPHTSLQTLFYITTVSLVHLNKKIKTNYNPIISNIWYIFKIPQLLPKYLNSLYFPLTLLLFSHSVTSNSLWPHGLQHARLPCPSLSPGVCSNSPLSLMSY